MPRRLAIVLAVLLCFAQGAQADSHAYVKVPIADVHSQADPSSEQVTQILMWDKVKVVGTRGRWTSILVSEQYRTPAGYPGWVRSSSLAFQSKPRGKDFVAVAYPVVSVFAQPSLDSKVLERVYLATRLPLLVGRDIKAEGETWHTVRLPGRQAPAFVRARQVQVEKVPGVTAGYSLIDTGKQFKGVPYLWGGMSREGIDCSGFVYVLYRMRGVTLPRDADQQFEIGEEVLAKNLLPGDLVFFGGKPGEITHVGLYAGKGQFIHASSSYGVATSPLFTGYYKNRLQGARRILNQPGDEARVLDPKSVY